MSNGIQKKKLYLKFEKFEITRDQQSYRGEKKLHNKNIDYKGGKKFQIIRLYSPLKWSFNEKYNKGIIS